MAITCTPSELLKKYSCLQCLSQKELIALLAIILSTGTAYENDVPRLLRASACFGCLTDKQMLQGFTALLADTVLPASVTVTQLREKIKCLLCADPKTVRAAVLYLICQNTTPLQ